MTDPAVTSTIDLAAPGKQIGRLQIHKVENKGRQNRRVRIRIVD